jgi:hypothetical protein
MGVGILISVGSGRGAVGIQVVTLLEMVSVLWESYQ